MGDYDDFTKGLSNRVWHLTGHRVGNDSTPNELQRNIRFCSRLESGISLYTADLGHRPSQEEWSRTGKEANKE